MEIAQLPIVALLADRQVPEQGQIERQDSAMKTVGSHDKSPPSSGGELGRIPSHTPCSAKPRRLAPSLSGSWAGIFLRGILLLLGLTALVGSGAEAPAAGTIAKATTSPGAPAPEVMAGDDFTGMKLEDLMKVEVPVVYGASKHEQKITEAPSAVSIVTADEIKKNGHRTLKDVLNSVRGFYVTYDRIYSYIGVRGVNRPGDFGGRILITIDGHRMNDPIYDSALSGTEAFLDVDLIDRVEVIRGPGSSLYGNNAFFGVINIITRKGRSVNWGEASASILSGETYGGRFTVGHQFTNGVEFLVSGSIQESQGDTRLKYSEYSSINGGVAEDLDYDRNARLFASVSYEGFTLSGGYSERKKGNPSAAYAVVFNERPAFVFDQPAFAELKYAHEFENDWSFLGRAFYNYYHFDADYVYDYGGVGNPADYTVNRDIAESHAVGGEIQITKKLLDKHRLTFGGEIRNDVSLTLKNFDVASGATYLDANEDADNYGFYGQGEFLLATPLVFNAGVRYDHLKKFGGTVNPRAALIYTPWKDTTFKALYGQAFRAPNVFEFGYLSPTYDANPNLKPETIRTYELVWEQGFARYYRFTASGFYNQIDDLVTRETTSANHLIFLNSDSVNVAGAETELEALFPGGWRARVSYTFANAIVSKTNDRLSNSPQHVGKFGIIAPIFKEKIFASAEVQAMSSRQTARGDTVDGFAVCNLTLFSQNLLKNLEASVSLYNVFDTHYEHPVSVDFRQKAIEQEGRSFRFKLTYKF